MSTSTVLLVRPGLLEVATVPLAVTWAASSGLASAGRLLLAEESSDAKLLGVAAIITATLTGLGSLLIAGATAIERLRASRRRTSDAPPSDVEVERAREVLRRAEDQP